MSKSTDVFDAMILRLESVLPTHSRLRNPYEIEENNTLFLKKGFGLAIGQGNGPNTALSKQIEIERIFQVVLTRKAYAKESDSTGKASAEKSLLEDLFLVIQEFETNTTINSTASMAQYESDGGIEFVETETEGFIVIRADILVKYQESL